MSGNALHHKITPRHLERQAIVYLRQSSARQVQENVESQRLQYALADRAKELGWRRVEIIDVDLGSSATAGADPRVGFDALIASVARGEVGIVFSREVSRLIRTDKDWCRLFEVCQVFGTLVGDGERIYDPNNVDDWVILGIKGTISVAEIRTIALRMLDAMKKKAERGELRRLLPPGYLYDVDGKPVKDPNLRVQEAIGLVFSKFRELGSVRQTFRWFHESEVELPVNKHHKVGMPGTRTHVGWQVPTQAFVTNLLHNPFYAGAYVYGRRETETVFEDGQLRKRVGSLHRPDQCRVFLRDHHEEYIDWQTFEENLRLMSDNNLKRGSDEAVGAVRAGQGLLVGLLRCRRCGRKLSVRYLGRSGTSARYQCKGTYDGGGKRYCVGFSGRLVDRRVSEEILRVISPLGIEASLAAIEDIESGDRERRRAVAMRLEQLEFEARRAFEQYDEVDPRNRLVAGELERRWNAKLAEVEQTRQELAELEEEIRPLGEAGRDRILALGDGFANVWESERCSVELKKRIARTLIEEIIVDVEDEPLVVRLIIHWKGGAHTELTTAKLSRPLGQRTADEDIEIIRKMAPRYGDDDIARVLNEMERHTGKGNPWTVERVAAARHRGSISGRRRTERDSEILTLASAAKHAGVSPTTIKRLVAACILGKKQIVPWAPWEIRRVDLDADPVRGILDRLRRTGKLDIEGDDSPEQQHLFQQPSETCNER